MITESAVHLWRESFTFKRKGVAFGNRSIERLGRLFHLFVAWRLRQLLFAGRQGIVRNAGAGPGEDDPDRDAMYDLGVIATAMQLLKLPDGTVRVLVEGVKRARLVDLVSRDGFMAAEVEDIEEESADGPEVQALMRSVIDQFENYAKLNKRLPAETGIQLAEIEQASALADAAASNLAIKVADKQALLGELNPARRLEMVFAFMEGELGVLQVEKKIRSRVKRQMEKTQREYYLNEQLKAIQRELGNESEEGGDELQE